MNQSNPSVQFGLYPFATNHVLYLSRDTKNIRLSSYEFYDHWFCDYSFIGKITFVIWMNCQWIV